MNENVKLSIMMLSYNHEKYIERAIQSVLDQEHNYNYELIISDDNSTDNTREIILDFKNRYPAIIKTQFSEQNIGSTKNGLKTLKLCTGQYIAILDGDDYWTYPKKIAIQIDFLDKNPDYSLSCHRFNTYNEQTKEMSLDKCPHLFSDNTDGIDVNTELFFMNWVTQTLTTVFRRELLDFKQFETYNFFRDTHLYFQLLQKGKGYVHNFFGGVYNIHEGGIWSSENVFQQRHTTFLIVNELLEHAPQVSRLRWELNHRYKDLVRLTIEDFSIEKFKRTRAAYKITKKRNTWLKAWDKSHS